MDVTAALILLVLFQVKHMFADFFLQTPIMLGGRSVYVHVGRALHCLIHVLGSALVLVLLGIPVGVFATLIVAEWIVHYHIDYGKGVWSEWAGHSPQDASYWRAFGVDQALHQVTYVVMVAVLA